MRFDIGKRLLPCLGRGRSSGGHERRGEIDSALHSVNTMAIRAVVLEEGRNALVEDLFRFCLQCREILSLRRCSRRQGQCKAQEG